MRHPLIALAVLTLASVASAQQYKRPLKKAAEALEDAAKQARRAGPQCKQAVYEQLDELADQVDDLKKQGRPRDAARLKFEVANVGSTASWSGCPNGVVQSIHRAEDFLDEARTSMFSDRRDDDDDDDDEDNRFQLAQMNPLQVQLNSNFESEPAVKVIMPELTLRNLRGQRFYLGARFRSFQGHWSEWVTTQQWTVPADPFIWKNPFSHFFRYSTLAEDDFSNGRFVARVSVFDGSGRELAFREVSFVVNRLPQLPPMPVVIAPPPVQQPPVQVRDCGTGPDVGCSMVRDGRYPMEGATFLGFMRSLQSNTSEMMRAQTVQTMFNTNYATAVQFGLVLDLFQSEMFKMQIAQQGAPRVVNPQHAIGYADKFNSNMFRTQYTQVMAQQQGGGQPPPNRPPQTGPFPGQPPPPPPPPGNAGRDCGTGPQDPGCGMRRNGMWAMDAMAWSGMYQSVRSTANELIRQDMVQQSLSNQALTAAQLGLLMDLFNNEITRLDVAKFAATRVVNPMHAIGLSTKFNNSILAQDFVTVMGRQR